MLYLWHTMSLKLYLHYGKLVGIKNTEYFFCSLKSTNLAWIFP